MPECNGCGRHVSSDFARVLGSNDGQVERCVECGRMGRVPYTVPLAADGDGDTEEAA